MKKLFSILLAVVMIVGMITMSAITAFAAELPTVEIGTGNELIAFMNHVNNGDYDNGVNAILTADIDISMTEGLSDFDNVGYDDGFGYFSLTRGIGYDSKHPFKGTFDGNGHYINYFYDCDVEESLIHSLFAVNEGTIKNLTVGIPGDPDNTGWFYAVNVRECHTAGVCGVNKGTIDGCVNYLDVRGINVVGGIAAYNEGTVINCLNYNRVMGSSDNSFVGGIVGKQDDGRVYNCANYGEVLVDYYTGTSAGIVGCSNGGEVSSCFVGGTVSGHDPHTVVGKNNGATVTENYYEIKDGLPADDNAEGIEKALIDSGYAVSLLRDASKNIEGAKTWFIGADGYPAFVGSDVPSFLTETVYYTAENGIVTVGGTGNIPANAFENDNTIKEVILGEGITSVGANAFTGCANLHTITVKGQSITFETYALRGITGANAFTVEKSDGTKTDIVASAIEDSLSGNIKAVYIHRFDRTRDVVTAPACTAEGYTTHYCRDCDFTYTDTITETTGHHYTQKRLADKVVAPTCTEKGSITHYCDDCDYSYTEEIASKHSDVKIERVIHSNCLEKGLVKEYCSVCGALCYERELEKVPHCVDKDGKCTLCGTEIIRYMTDKSDEVFCYPGADSITVNVGVLNTVLDHIQIYDKNGNLIGEGSGPTSRGARGKVKLDNPVFSDDNRLLSGSATVKGDTVHITVRVGGNLGSIVPHYPEDADTQNIAYNVLRDQVYIYNKVKDKMVAPTCMEKGYILYEYQDSSKAHKVEIPAKGHNLVQSIEGFTGCSSNCTVTYHCTECDVSFKRTQKIDHYYDKNGKCIGCGEGMRLYRYDRGSATYTVAFADADSVNIHFDNVDEHCSYCIYDCDGKERAALWGMWDGTRGNIAKFGNSTVIHDAVFTVSLVYSAVSFTPHYCTEENSGDNTDSDLSPAEETATTPEQNQPENGNSSNTASVLSDGNLWIILVVAVLAIGGIATLVIVKKKKKPAAAGVAADEE